MTTDETIAMLLDRLGLTVTAVGEARVAACQSILADAFAEQEPLPNSWFEVMDLVDALERDALAGSTHDFLQIYGPLNQAVNTMNVPFPYHIRWGPNIRSGRRRVSDSVPSLDARRSAREDVGLTC